ncbi:helix-turn-helix protein [Stieleria neptunia]|uniref:Helix-turn-helix protein n=1 Tax=Stieleria neptunia TaxID=2527979 RepID=A0A518HY91_9BACT|nr:helix-turn-helix transcriptional regulator [Stieleria neptunia]QDV45810.1 helix-turn-helix protein [Stieleria neptunia]
MQFSDKVRELRVSRHLTQQQLAEQMGVSASYICKVENDGLQFGDYPSETFIQRLAATLNADEYDLMMLADKVPESIRIRIRERPSLFKAIAKLDDQSLDRLTLQLTD